MLIYSTDYSKAKVNLYSGGTITTFFTLLIYETVQVRRFLIQRELN